ncbi:hypothetical protein CG394_08575, partial [Gardnerella vaginalis]
QLKKQNQSQIGTTATTNYT